MTQLEEKIDGFVNVYCDGYSPSAKGVARNMLRSIATQAVEEYKKELLEKLPEHVENGDSPRSSNPIDEYIWHEQNGKNSMLSRVKSLINKSN